MSLSEVRWDNGKTSGGRRGHKFGRAMQAMREKQTQSPLQSTEGETVDVVGGEGFEPPAFWV